MKWEGKLARGASEILLTRRYLQCIDCLNEAVPHVYHQQITEIFGGMERSGRGAWATANLLTSFNIQGIHLFDLRFAFRVNLTFFPLI